MGADPAKEEIFQDEAWNHYAIAIGQAVLAWNDLHGWLACLLQSVLYPRQGEHQWHLTEIWNAMTQDRAARQMLRAATNFHFRSGIGCDQHEKIMWLLGQVDKLEDARNDIIHTRLIRDESGRVVVCSEGTRRAANLASKPDLLAEIHWCRDTAIVLRNYVLDIDRGLESVHGTLPSKPSLPNRRQRKTPPSPLPQPQSG
jgi:hypothetical protein